METIVTKKIDALLEEAYSYHVRFTESREASVARGYHPEDPELKNLLAIVYDFLDAQISSYLLWGLEETCNKCGVPDEVSQKRLRVRNRFSCHIQALRSTLTNRDLDNFYQKIVQIVENMIGEQGSFTRAIQIITEYYKNKQEVITLVYGVPSETPGPFPITRNLKPSRRAA